MLPRGTAEGNGTIVDRLAGDDIGEFRCVPDVCQEDNLTGHEVTCRARLSADEAATTCSATDSSQAARRPPSRLRGRLDPESRGQNNWPIKHSEAVPMI